MKTTSLCLVLAVCALAVHVNANLAGVGMAVDIQVIDKVKNYAIPIVLKNINDMKMEKITFD